jgi:hypothetical protein
MTRRLISPTPGGKIEPWSDLSTFLPTTTLAAQRNGREETLRYRRLIAARLLLVTIGAFSGLFVFAVGGKNSHQLDIAGLAGLAAFFLVLLVRVSLGQDRRDDVARQAQAVADISESLAWRFAVGGDPLVRRDPDDAAKLEFINTVQALNQNLIAAAAPTGSQITEPMKVLRSEPNLEIRKAAYLQGRLRQLHDRAQKENKESDKRGRQWIRLVITMELVGVAGAIAKSTRLTGLDLLGFSGAAAASLGIWIETRRYRDVATRAASRTQILAVGEEIAKDISDERQWAEFVGKIEDQLTIDARAVFVADSGVSSASIKPDEAAYREMSADRYFSAVQDLKRQIFDEGTDRHEKFDPDIIVPVNPGGAIVGGMLYFLTNRAASFVPLSFRSGLTTKDLKAITRTIPRTPKNRRHLALLLVDASAKTGGSLRDAVELVEQALQEAGWMPEERVGGGSASPGRIRILRLHRLRQLLPPGEGWTSQEGQEKRYVLRTAVLTCRDDTDPRIDYYIDKTTERFPYGRV